MVVSYITGASSGLGKSIAELLLEKENHFVRGISRTSTINHQRYSHIKKDLSMKINNSFFSKLPNNCKKVILINNAADIGPVTRINNQSYEDIFFNYQLNLITPSVLCGQFINSYKNIRCVKLIINISSGASNNAIQAWGTYCASKSGLDMFTRVISKENPSFKIFSISPGIIDTKMQNKIRNSKKEQFPKLDHFKSYKTNGELAKPRDIAIKILKIIDFPEDYTDVKLSVRDM